MEAVDLFGTLELLCQTSRCHIPEVHTLVIHLHVNLVVSFKVYYLKERMTEQHVLCWAAVNVAADKLNGRR